MEDQEEIQEALWFLENMDDRFCHSDDEDIWNVESHLRDLRRYNPEYAFNMN